MTFKGETKNAYDYISLDLSDKSVKDMAISKEELRKQFKFKSDSKSLSVNKDGDITVKSVPNDNKGTISITLKKNAKSVDGLYKLNVNINPAVVTNTDNALGVIFNKTNFEAKEKFKDISTAKTAAGKIPVIIPSGNKKITLKKGKDYDEVKVEQVGNATTGASIQFILSTKFQGNYVGTITGSVTCNIPK
jgi:hypothetical protein